MPRLPLHALYTAANPTTGPALHARSPRRTACPPTAHQACGGSSRGTDGGGAATVPRQGCGRHHHQRHRRCRGVAKGTFYHYFQAKTDILLALRERFTQAFQQRIANAVEACPANDHPGRLRAWTESGLAGYLEGYRLHDVVYSEHHHHQRGNQERDRVLEQLAELLENGAAAGAWPLRNPRLNALLLYSGLHGAADDAIAGGRLDTQPLAGELADAFLRLLGASD
ncbi:TetR/AcrR family transcriptional regulator [Pseudomonas aeruginosa]|nr:TetR/AcrR family transcriptional regulator [Pseudomonas aeruginosa]